MLTRASIKRRDRHDVIVLGLYRIGVMIQEQIDVLFGADDFLFQVIPKLFGSPRRFCRFVGELFNNLADARKLAATNIAHRPNSNFTAAVAAEHRAILNQRDLAAHASR